MHDDSMNELIAC